MHKFSFDYVFSQESSQLEVFLKTTQDSLKKFFSGTNITVFAYGQTGSGKTFTGWYLGRGAHLLIGSGRRRQAPKLEGLAHAVD